MRKDIKTFDVFYYNYEDGKIKEVSHKYPETYEKTDYFCYKCGNKGLWDECGGGDYYVGENWVCTGCGVVFTMQIGSDNGLGDIQNQQRVENLTNEYKPK